MSHASLRHADYTSGGAVVGNSNLAARTPVVVIRFERDVQGLVVLVAIAQAAAALALTAAIVVRHDVVMTIGGIVTSAHPGDGGGLGARRAAVRRASTAGTQEPVDGAMPPVLAGLRVARIRG